MSPACSPVFLSFSQLSLVLSITPQLSLQSGWNRNLSIQWLTTRCQLLLSALSVSPARSGLRAGAAHVGLFFCFFSLLFSYLVFVSLLVLFLSILGSILGPCWGAKTHPGAPRRDPLAPKGASEAEKSASRSHPIKKTHIQKEIPNIFQNWTP